MTDWTSGYVADIGYTFGYYTELNPLRAQLAFINAGLAAPSMGVHCELGFGQGISTNVHAAGSGAVWYGTDFNPSQAAFAQELAGASGAPAKLFDQAFADFCARQDLPDFDSIGLHGIWSWISDENRAVIVDFVRRKLKVGGVLYISYNTQPGWAAMVPMRNLLVEHGAVMGSSGQGVVPRVDGALAFADKLLATNPAYARANPQVADRIKKMKEQNRNYLAHEYFNRDWQPMGFSEMAQWLGPAKLNYACSANYLDHVDAINLSPPQLALLQEIPDPVFRQTVRDFCVNQQFRKDYWVKGPRKLAPAEASKAAQAHRVLLITPRADVSLKVAAGLGEVSMSEPIYGPILDLLANHQVQSLGALAPQLAQKNISFAQLLQAVTMLAGTGVLASVQDDGTVHAVKPFTDKLNAHLMSLARYSADVSTLSSPVTGGGIAVPRFVQLYLLARSEGRLHPAQWAQYCWEALKAQNQRVMKDGKPLMEEGENLAELTDQAEKFSVKGLPVLSALGIA